MSTVSSEPAGQPRKTIANAVAAGNLTPEAGANLNRWLEEPYYSEYRQGIWQLIKESDFARLNELFWERIPFGTGGRRGPMSEFGSATINARTIAESAHGPSLGAATAVHWTATPISFDWWAVAARWQTHFAEIGVGQRKSQVFAHKFVRLRSREQWLGLFRDGS